MPRSQTHFRTTSAASRSITVFIRTGASETETHVAACRTRQYVRDHHIFEHRNREPAHGRPAGRQADDVIEFGTAEHVGEPIDQRLAGRDQIIAFEQAVATEPGQFAGSSNNQGLHMLLFHLSPPIFMQVSMEAQ